MPKRKEPDPAANTGAELEMLIATTTADIDNNLPYQSKLAKWSSRLIELNTEKSFIQGLIQNKPNDKRFNDKYASTAAALLALQNAIATVENKQQAVVQQFANAKQLATLTITSGNGNQDEAGDKNTYIQFVNIGLGDCTIVTTPTGKRILIDCGCDSSSDIILDNTLLPYFEDTPFEYVGHQLNSKRFLNGSKTIDILIYSHPDGDHHNRTEDVLSSLGITDISIVYYSGTKAFTAGPFRDTKAYVAGRCPDSDNIRLITLKEDINDANKVIKLIDSTTPGDQPGKAGEIGKEYIDNTGAIVLYYEENFKLSALSGRTDGAWKNGNYLKLENKIKEPNEYSLNSDKFNKNRGSSIIMVESYGTKTLICGDATAVTEQFVINRFNGILGQVKTLRMGHHASATSSYESFINAQLILEEAVASTPGQNTSKHHLPRAAILELYQPLKVVINPPPAQHTLYAWSRTKKYRRINITNTTDNLWATGSNGSKINKIKKPAN